MAKKTINGFDIITNVDVSAPSAPANPSLDFFDDFESTTRPITYTGDWIRTTADFYDGTASLTNADITNNETSSVEITVPANGVVSFYWKVSSEGGYDFFDFSINGAGPELHESGLVDWTYHEVAVNQGDILQWSYTKDSSVSNNADSAYIDALSFVEGGTVTPPAPQPSCKLYSDITLDDMRYDIVNSDYVTIQINETIDTLWEPYGTGFQIGTDGGWYVYQRPRASSAEQSGIKIYEPRTLDTAEHIVSQYFRPDKFCVYVKAYDVPTSVDPTITVELMDGNADIVLSTATFTGTYTDYANGDAISRVHSLSLTNTARDYMVQYTIPNTTGLYSGTARPTHLRVTTGDHGVIVRLVRPLNSDDTETAYVFAQSAYALSSV